MTKIAIVVSDQCRESITSTCRCTL